MEQDCSTGEQVAHSEEVGCMQSIPNTTIDPLSTIDGAKSLETTDDVMAVLTLDLFSRLASSHELNTSQNGAASDASHPHSDIVRHIELDASISVPPPLHQSSSSPRPLSFANGRVGEEMGSSLPPLPQPVSSHGQAYQSFWNVKEGGTVVPVPWTIKDSNWSVGADQLKVGWDDDTLQQPIGKPGIEPQMERSDNSNGFSTPMFSSMPLKSTSDYVDDDTPTYEHQTVPDTLAKGNPIYRCKWNQEGCKEERCVRFAWRGAVKDMKMINGKKVPPYILIQCPKCNGVYKRPPPELVLDEAFVDFELVTQRRNNCGQCGKPKRSSDCQCARKTPKEKVKDQVNASLIEDLVPLRSTVQAPAPRAPRTESTPAFSSVRSDSFPFVHDEQASHCVTSKPPSKGAMMNSIADDQSDSVSVNASTPISDSALNRSVVHPNACQVQSALSFRNGHAVHNFLKLKTKKVCGDGSCWVYAVLASLGLCEHADVHTEQSATLSDRLRDAYCRQKVVELLQKQSSALQLTKEDMDELSSVKDGPVYPIDSEDDYGSFGTITTISGLALLFKTTIVLWNCQTLRVASAKQQVIKYLPLSRRGVNEETWSNEEIAAYSIQNASIHIMWNGINHYSAMVPAQFVKIDTDLYRHLSEIKHDVTHPCCYCGCETASNGNNRPPVDTVGCDHKLRGQHVCNEYACINCLEMTQEQFAKHNAEDRLWYCDRHRGKRVCWWKQHGKSKRAK